MPKQCPHKLLKKQMSGMQVWYICGVPTWLLGALLDIVAEADQSNGGKGAKLPIVLYMRELADKAVQRLIAESCGQKFKAQEWDGKVKVVRKEQ